MELESLGIVFWLDEMLWGLLVNCWCCLGSDCHSKRLLSCKRVKRESWGRKTFYLLFYWMQGSSKLTLQWASASLLLSSLLLWLLRVIFTLSQHPPLFLSHLCWLLHPQQFLSCHWNGRARKTSKERNRERELKATHMYFTQAVGI